MSTYDHEPSPAERGDYWVAVHTWIFQVDGLSHNGLSVYIGLASFADRAGIAWPSIQAIAERMRLSPSSVRRGVSELEALGLLTVQPTYRDGLQGSNRYRLRVTAPAPLPDAQPSVSETGDVSWETPDPLDSPVTGTAPGCHGDSPGVSQGQPRGVTVTAPGCHGDSQNTSKEHLQGTPPVNTSWRADARHDDDGRTRTRGTRIPSTFTVTDDMAQWAADRLPDLDHVTETERFIDYWRSASGQRAVKRDWVATWRNWMRRAHDDLVRRGSPRPALTLPTDPSAWDTITQELFTPTSYRDVMAGGGAR